MLKVQCKRSENQLIFYVAYQLAGYREGEIWTFIDNNGLTEKSYN